MALPALALVLAAMPQAPPQQAADLVLVGGTVLTLDPARPEAAALAIRDGRLLFLGSAAEARVFVGPATRVLDVGGGWILPGFQDAHGHLAGLATALLQVDLTGTRSYAEVVARVAAEAQHVPPGEWILGRGWDQNDWEETRFPEHGALSEAIPEHPVALTRIDGHALLANARALELAGVDAATADPPGGRILRDGSGSPTGVFVDGAMALVRRQVPPVTRERLREGIRRAIARLHRHGVTAIHDAGVGTATIRLYEEMDRDGEFLLRDHVMLSADEQTLGEWLPGGPVADLTGDGRLAVRAIKMVADGALGSRGAALLEDYSDEPGNRGLLTTPPERIEAVAEQALRHGFQLCVHAIGDRANRLVLDAFARALERVPRADHRFRVEHAQILHASDVGRFARLGVLPSMQAQHQTSDMPWAGRRLGAERLLGAYAWRSLLDTGVVIPGGSDFPVEEPDPLAAFRAAVTRQDEQGWPAGGWHPEQRMTRREALLHLTVWPAFAAFREKDLGPLRPRRRADLVVLSGDPRRVPDAALGRLEVEWTLFDGQVVHGPQP